jgi:hypothetical protein
MNFLKEEESKDDAKVKTNPRDLLKKKMAMKKAADTKQINHKSNAK